MAGAQGPEAGPTPEADGPPAEAPAPAVDLPEWAQEIRVAYQAAASVLFLLHGERDLAQFAGQWLPIREFLYRAFCAGKRVVYYNLGEGFSFPSPEDEAEFKRFAQVYLRQAQGTGGPLPLDPREALPMVEEWLLTRASTVLILDYVEKLVPQKPGAFLTPDEKRTLISLRRWATDPRVTARNNCVFLIADSLAEVHEEVYKTSSRVRLISVPMPDEDERLRYIERLLQLAPEDFPGAAAGAGLLAAEMDARLLAQSTNGLTRVQIADCLRQARSAGTPVALPLVTSWKKRSIEAELGELVEFAQPSVGLEALGGMDRQKKLLLDVARAMAKGQRGIAPKGIMLLGPPGCGKTFSMSCFAHDCGIPFLQLKNIFSKYVGATEANLEKLFHYLEALSPVFVFIDEFDQTYGRRVDSDSDSGVSRRVFAMFNAFLSDDAHQSKILFGAATNRPDLLDASTIRAGRFDLKIPYFLPDDATRRSIIEVTFRNLHVAHTVSSFDFAVASTAGYSGADLREVVVQAVRQAGLAGRDVVTQEDLDFAVRDYIPPGKADPDNVRYMELLAVSFTTSRALLDPKHLELVDSGGLQAELDDLLARIRFRGA